LAGVDASSIEAAGDDSRSIAADIDEAMSGLLSHPGNRRRLAVKEDAGASRWSGPRTNIGERVIGRPLSTFAIDDSSAGGR
jgi:hypothetical protein